MRTLLISLLFILSCTMGYAQDWQTDIDTAKERATAKDKKIILVFQGSDWCAPCIKLDKEIWSSEEFKNYANEHFVLVKADFPRRKKNKLAKAQQEKNNTLFEKYNKQGLFPFVAVLDKDGQLLGSTGYKKVSPSEYLKILTSF